MALQDSNGFISTRRDGQGSILDTVAAQIGKARYEFAPDGPRTVTRILIDPGQDVQAGDYVTIVGRSGEPQLPVQERAVTYTDYTSDEDGDLAVIALVIFGSILP